MVVRRSVFGPQKATIRVEEMLLEVCGEVRKIVAWNKLTHKAVVAEAYMHTPTSKSRYVLRLPAFLDMWCGDRNGMQPCMPEEARRETCTKALALVDDIKASVVQAQRHTLVPRGLLPENLSADSVRDVMETLLGSHTWWKDAAHVSKYSAEARFGHSNNVSSKDATSRMRVTSATSEIVDIDSDSESLHSCASGLDTDRLQRVRTGGVGSFADPKSSTWGDEATWDSGGPEFGAKHMNAQRLGSHAENVQECSTPIRMTKKEKSDQELLFKAVKVRLLDNTLTFLHPDSLETLKPL
jgi:hypothetical protein